MITEAEAKTKWCPYARLSMAQTAAPMKGRGADMGFAVGSPSGFNRVTVSNQEGVTIPDATLCVGSGCMAWRWKIKWRDYPNNDKFDRTDSGYCGAFGEPT